MVTAPDNFIVSLSLFVLSTNQKLFKLGLWAILYINNLCSFEHGELEHKWTVISDNTCTFLYHIFFFIIYLYTSIAIIKFKWSSICYCEIVWSLLKRLKYAILRIQIVTGDAWYNTNHEKLGDSSRSIVA
jgi:1,4-dihydroxy-2-naphthoate octaprenyltransferase